MKRPNGITLIALVITIIVLLILAGVSISMVTGDNGIVHKAANAKEQTLLETDKSNIELALSEYKIEKYGESASTLEDYLKNKDWCQNANTVGTKTIVTMDNSKIYTIDNNGNITEGNGLSGIELYFLGKNGTGNMLSDLISNVDFSFKNNDVLSDASSIIISSVNDTYGTMNIIYKNTFYILYFDLETSKALNLIPASCIYTGNRQITEEDKDASGYKIEFAELNVSIDLDKKYIMIFEVDGQEISIESHFQFWLNSPSMMFYNEDASIFTVINDETFYIVGNLCNPASYEIYLKYIYQFGEAEDCVEKDGFIIAKRDDDVWGLVQSPSGTYTIPTEINGIPVERVYLDCIIDNPIFTQPFELSITGEPVYLGDVKVITSDIEFIINSGGGFAKSFDFSECDDDIALTTTFVENNSNTIIYVSENVKKLFESYSNVVAK